MFLRQTPSNNKLIYNWYRVSRKGPRKVASFFRSSKRPFSEDWEGWYRTTLKRELDKLLSNDSFVSNYINVEFLERIKRENNVHWIKVVASAEISLRLAANGWKRP